MTADQLRAGLGIPVLLLLAWACGERRRGVPWARVGIGLLLTVGLLALLLKVPALRGALASVNDAVNAVAAATRAGTALVFGYLGGAPLPFESRVPGGEFVLAFQALPLALVMSVLSTLLFHWRVLPPIVRGFSWLLERTLGVGGAVGVSTAANVFVGMVEAPMFIRPYLDRLSRGELFIVMTGGMAGIAGTVFVVYATLLGPVMPDVATHLLIASVAGAPAAILFSQIMVPEEPGCSGGRESSGQDPGGADRAGEIGPVASGTMDAIVKGTTGGLELLLNVAAMLIVFVALVHLANAVLGAAVGVVLGLLPGIPGTAEPVTLQRLLGLLMAPLCWLLGVPWREAATAGALLGMKTVLNEFVAYLELAHLPDEALSPRSRLIMVYALCGFANFGSLGIMVGGLATMAPGRRAEIVALGPRTLVSGTLATCLLGAIVGLLT